MMPGVQFEEIWNAMKDAFEDLDALDMMLRLRLNIKRQNIVASGALDTVVFKLLEKAEAQGWDVDLVKAAHRQVPGNSSLAGVYQKYGLALTAAVQEAGTASALLPATDPGFERMVTDVQMLDMNLWREKMAKVEGRVCRVEINGRGIGTGFLVGPDAVLTNYHVLEGVLNGRIEPAAVACRFDYKVLSDGTRSDGVQVRLHATDWRVDDSRYSEAEKAGRPSEKDPTADELDYALVRLERPAGKEPIEPKAAPGASARGWIAVPEGTPTFEPGMPLLIAQHPDAAPLKLALDTKAVIEENASHTRVRYATNTEPGASGSPCFSLAWDLVALHHYGDAAFGHPKFNQGVPIGLVRDRLKRNNKMSFPGGNAA